MCDVFKVINYIMPAYLKTYFAIEYSFYETRTATPLFLPNLGR